MVEDDRGRPVVTVDLDRPRRLRFDMSGLRLFKGATGVSILKNPQGFFLLDLDESTIPEFVWAFGRHEDPDLTVDEVTGHLTLKHIAPLSEAIIALVVHGLHEMEMINREKREQMLSALRNGDGNGDSGPTSDDEEAEHGEALEVGEESPLARVPVS